MKVKMKTIGGKYYVDDGRKLIVFDTAIDAWQYILLLKEIRHKASIPARTLYPVRSLNPMPTRGCKKVVHTGL